MIEPYLADDAFLADVRRSAPEPGFRLWWLGQSGFLLQWQGRHLLLDPYLSDSLTEKYRHTDKPHVRMTRRVVAPDRLDFIDVVTSSHNHTDHLDAQTLLPILHANPNVTIVVGAANQAFAAERLGLPPERLVAIDAFASVEAGPFRLTAVPAAHEALARDEAGRYLFLGFVVHFGEDALFHSGDTVAYPEQATWVNQALSGRSLDVALLPINGRAPERRVAGNLDGPEAARLARALRARLVIPCHYEMFTFNTASPTAFVAEAERLGQAYRLLRAGERFDSRDRSG